LSSDKKLTKLIAKDYLRKYDEHLGGNREDLICRLREFAHSKEVWERCVPTNLRANSLVSPQSSRLFAPAASRLRGAATGSRSSRPSAKRAREQFGDDTRLSCEYPSKKTSNSIPDRRTISDIENVRAWVSQKLAVVGRDPDRVNFQTKADGVLGTRTQSVSIPPSATEECMQDVQLDKAPAQVRQFSCCVAKS
jgi:hypothetical protein